jgi:hypothetical protein
MLSNPHHHESIANWLEIERGELGSPQINPRALELWGNQELQLVIRDTRTRSHPTNALRDWPTEYRVLDPRAPRIHRIWYQMTHRWSPASRRRREHDKRNRKSPGKGKGPWTPRALLFSIRNTIVHSVYTLGYISSHTLTNVAHKLYIQTK